MEIPAPAEVAAYAASIGFKLDGGYFVDYWAERGWYVKPGLLMRDWKATVRNWKRMDEARKSGAAPAPAETPAAERKRYESERRAAVILDHAERIVAMMSWLKSQTPCPFSTDPQGVIDDDVAKIRDHYGHKGVEDLRAKVRELRRAKS